MGGEEEEEQQQQQQEQEEEQEEEEEEEQEEEGHEHEHRQEQQQTWGTAARWTHSKCTTIVPSLATRQSEYPTRPMCAG